jgi:hypothetical protein
MEIFELKGKTLDEMIILKSRGGDGHICVSAN